MNPQAQVWASALAGQVVGGYRMLGCVGAGNFGVVFEVERVDTSARFAMKILVPTGDPGAAVEFEREGILLKKLVRASGVINLIDTGQATLMMQVGGPGGPTVPIVLRFHVLTLASGVLTELTVDPARLDQLAWRERLQLWRGAVKGVHQMHLKEVAHRDLKGDNCLLVVQGSQSDVRVADLGRAKDFSVTPSVSQWEYLHGRGDARFAPPEYLWLQGTSDAEGFRSADLYGLGSILVELTTGHPTTALAVASWEDARAAGLVDIQTGVRRDLAVLRPQFRRAFEEIGEAMPTPIRHGATKLLSQLCDPVPSERHPRTALGRRAKVQPGLDWLIRRADIFGKQMSAHTSGRPKYKKSRSA